MSISCKIKGHKWYDGRCTKCGKEYTNYGPLEQLEGKICAKNLFDRAYIINSLPQEPLIYLAENAVNFSVVDMALPKIKNEDKIAEIALKRGNRDLCYKAVILCDKPENIELFTRLSDTTVKDFAKEKLKASKLQTKEEIEEYMSNKGWSIDPVVKSYLDTKLSKLS